MSPQISRTLPGKAELPLYIAVFPVLAWAGNFVVAQFAMQFYRPLALTALRFLIIGATVVYFGWPKHSLRVVGLYALLSAGGQYTLSTLAIYLGLSAGLASLVMQGQVFIVALLGFVLLKERPRMCTVIGAAFGFGGLAVLTSTKSQAFSFTGFLVCVLASACWACSSLQLRIIKTKGLNELFSLQAASCLIAFPFVSLLSWKFEQMPFHVATIAGHPLAAGAVVAYMSVVSLFVAQGLWGRLLSERPVNTVAPFALLIPVFGIGLSYSILNEQLTPVQILSCGLVLAGLMLHFYGIWSARHV